MLTALSPVDGRYQSKTQSLSAYFSEFALIKYRLRVEVLYFKALTQSGLPQLADFPVEKLAQVEKDIDQLTPEEAAKVKDIEKTTNHDVKAVEYYLKELFDKYGISAWKEFIHFGLTSQDINNTAVPLSFKEASAAVIRPSIEKVLAQIQTAANEWSAVAMLAHTHGQPASPTLLGKEFMVYVDRLQIQLAQVSAIAFPAKFGGATGNLNAHYVTYPDTNWHAFADTFVSEYLGLSRSRYTTQIEHYDNLAALFHAWARINTILIDFCRDIWTYISMNYFRQKTVKGEVGSSAMPHKVNPIDFENAEGNLGVANALLTHLAEKLPVSRLQRDLTDSTVLRNIGVPFGHMLIAFESIQKGMGKLLLNEEKLRADLENNWAVVAEAIQNILRREAYPQPYEALKELTRGKTQITAEDISGFIQTLDVSAAIKAELSAITPWNYTGKTYPG